MFWGYIYRGLGAMGLLDIVVLLRTPPIYGLSYPLSNPHILLLTIIINISKIYVDKMWITLWISVDNFVSFYTINTISDQQQVSILFQKQPCVSPTLCILY